MRNILAIACLLFFMGCYAHDPAYVKNEKEYGVTNGPFRHRWWNYYERGLSFAEGEFYAEAAEDFNAAIQKRGNDNWSSRTYGMHLVHYFPHRELGIVYFKTNRYEDAEQELEQSLSTAESAKAKFFLNRTRKAILEKTGNDRNPPSINISYPLNNTITNRFSVNVRGTVEDDFFVSSLKLNSLPVYIELSVKRISFNKNIALKKGVNQIRIGAGDLTGKTSSREVQIFFDAEGPVIIIDEVNPKGETVFISGTLTDNTGIKSFTINGRPVFADSNNVYTKQSNDLPGQHVTFSYEVKNENSSRTIKLAVTDFAGNITQGELNISSPISLHSSKSLLASSGQLVFFDKITDRTPPEIILRELMDFQTVYSDSLYIEGSAFDRSRIKDIFINGESLLKRSGSKIFFNYLVKLREGVNSFFIEAIDLFGNKAQKQITVKREVPKVRKLGARMSISVLPFEIKGSWSVSGSAVYESLISAFVNQKRFRIIERDKIEEVLSELELSRTSLVDPGTASKIGKLVVADAILIGTVYEYKNSLEVLTRLIDTETGDIIGAEDVYDEDKSLIAVNRLGKGLAVKYRENFPLLEGLIVEKTGKVLIIDLGENTNIKRNMGLILFREGKEIMHPLSGRSLGNKPEELGEAKIDYVYEKLSSAVIKKGKPEEIRLSDKVITK